MTVRDFIRLFKKMIFVILATAVLMFILGYFFPDEQAMSLAIMKEYSLEVILVFPAVLVLMGLVDIWMPREMVRRHFGDTAGFRGLLLSVFLGTLPAGPLFIAFPIAGKMLRKGARVANVVAFMGAWASLKMSEIGMEIYFLGVKFAFLRVVLTLIAVLGIALITEKMLTVAGKELTKESI